ncbi:glycosyl hydrolase, partial [Clostridium botulinum]|nr:glycosyl hydrolase [Clostridium botulinum]NFP13390.1 glycosyl hydrolase [Clostridium botulinum]NFR30908.1 glycosyl hydrolase [Clostridium botulinum]NFU56256.1 glycosyl hydrolase [Clostridium botulinum]NFV00655.1 glycosyl hydrolase [Clostridium botulinum]
WYNNSLNRKCGIWQYSENGRVPGIAGAAVDMNYCYLNMAEGPNTKLNNNTSRGDHYLIRELQQEINSQGFGEVVVDGIAGQATINSAPICKQGERGGITKVIQQMLINIGYPVGSHGADGVFGDDTVTAIKAFQRDCHLVVDGIVGKETWEALFRNLK